MGAPAAKPLGREPQMRILLKEASRLALRADGDQRLRVYGIDGGVRQPRRLTLHLQAGRLVAELDGRRQVLPTGRELRVTNEDPRGIWLGSRRYRGVLNLRASGGQLRVINHLGIESYLASVVGSEMPHQWPLAALQAQSVAARTYALRNRNRAGLWDVKATVASQVYRGVESETPSTLQAVSSTRSLVLVHGGKLINAVFHSSSGGTTEASGMVWRQQLPYLVSVPDHDQHSPMHRWQQWFDSAGLQQRLPETGGVDAVQVLRRSSSGRVQQARLNGPGGPWCSPAPICAADSVSKAPWWSSSWCPPDPPPPGPERVRSGHDGRNHGSIASPHPWDALGLVRALRWLHRRHRRGKASHRGDQRRGCSCWCAARAMAMASA